MRVVYSDESGTGSQCEEPATIVTALMLNMDSQWKPVRDAVEAAIWDSVKPPPKLSRYALKGKNIYHQIDRGKADARELMTRLMAIPKQCLVPIFYGAVDRAGFRAQMKANRQWSALKDGLRPFRLAFQNCMQKVDTYVHLSFRDEEVLWIHDAGSLDGVTKDSLRSWRGWLREVTQEIEIMKQEKQISMEIEPHVSHVADMIYFGKDEESRLLQLADCCCSTITRYLKGDPIATLYYEIIRDQIIGGNERPQYEGAGKLIESIKTHLRIQRRTYKR